MQVAAQQQDVPSIRRCRVLLAESDPDVRTALRLVLERMPRFVLVGQSENVEALLRDSALLQPELILVDLDLRGMRLDDHLANLLSHGVTTIALSTHDEYRQLALAAGAAAFVCKGESPRKLLETLESVSAPRV
jgi:DNA-binding NarL/FixJ family response regulator